MPTGELSPKLSGFDLEFYMREALKEAEAAGRAGELPIGSVVVIQGQIVSRGRAEHKQQRSQIRHAEMNALLAGGQSLWDDFRNAVLFTTVEPCPMCLGAAVMADVPHIVFAAHDAVVYSRATLEANPYVKRHIQTYYGGVLESESHEVIGRYDPIMLQYCHFSRIVRSSFSPIVHRRFARIVRRPFSPIVHRSFSPMVHRPS